MDNSLEWKESKKRTAYVFLECNFENGQLYNVLLQTSYGYQLSQQYIVKDDDTLNCYEDYERMLKEAGYNVVLMPTTPSNGTFSIPKSQLWYCIQLESFKETMAEIESLPPIEMKDYTNSECTVTLYPQFIIYEINNFAVKLPRRYLHENGNTDWAYEYLIYPDFTVNEQALEMINNLYHKDFKLDLETLENNFLFSKEVYDFFRREFFYASSNVKAIANAIQVRELTNVCHNEYYKIFHESRMVKSDLVAHEKWEYNGIWKEVTFKNYIALINEDPDFIFNIAFDADKRNAYIKSKTSPVYAPINLFLESMSKDVDNVFIDYSDVESVRQEARKNIYFMHIGFGQPYKIVVQYLNMIGSTFESTLSVDLKSSLSWYVGDRLERVDRKYYKPRVKK